MNSIYNKFNSSRNFSRWYDWKAHRDQLTKIFKERALLKNKPSQNIIIFGAGNCDDIDLNCWLENVDELYLVDLDISSVKDALIRQKVDESKSLKIKLLNIDVSGLTKAGFPKKFEAMLVDEMPRKKIVSYIRKVANDLKPIDDLSDLYGSFSVVASSAMHTQLVIPYMLKTLDLLGDYLSPKEKKSLIDEAKYLIYKVIENYHQVLINLVEKDGALFIWLDAAEVSLELGNIGVLPDLEKAIRTSDLPYIQTIHQKFCIFGATVGTKDLFNRFPTFSHELDGSKNHWLYWLWPYDELKYYLLYCFVIRM
ncbi:hypothetical protein Desde_3207 [Desulfitobacterium dehalogenans ATCC 51507]|uniref:Class I SAM-dependent methyltransferase n=1 Tax=Desulfitobacterium dehalogenans (strain ATCC 51507 / DSM 9161 / JW/IU-DC1) TaxID=756499 RepID=I4AC13_DESDJ|nr:hypothetical protein [Desulfitobacterium dehalogenans]AFM01498.1 hypothetical protein Desde_3207 [Desulfitobacterium dehalogenans ATCC 51507]